MHINPITQKFNFPPSLLAIYSSLSIYIKLQNTYTFTMIRSLIYRLGQGYSMDWSQVV